MGDDRAERSSSIGDGAQAAVSLTPDLDGKHVCIFASLQLEGSYVGTYCTRNGSLLCISHWT